MFLRHLHREVAADARLFHTFFNQDAGNFVLISSQVDLIRRQDMPLFNLAEVTPERAASAETSIQ